jgi:competence protein ComEA
VKHPGVYTVDIHADTGEVLKKAGGLKKGADVSGINQTQDLSDHSVLVIGKQQEQKKISINSATEKELQTLTGIGPSMAQRIIAYRSQQPFQTIEDIMKVKGSKEKLFAKIKEQITL